MLRPWLCIALVTALGDAAIADDEPAPSSPVPEVPPAVDPPAVPAAVDDPPAVTESVPHVTVHGTVRGKKTAEPLVGVTVVAIGVGDRNNETAITDENGQYTLRVVPGRYEVTLYYVDATSVLGPIVVSENTELATSLLDENSNQNYGCVFDYNEGPTLSSYPRFGLTVGRDFRPVARDRTHRAWIAPVAAADPRTAVGSIDGGVRLQSAPGIPVAFLEEVGTYTLRVPIKLATGSGGASEIALRSGSNQMKGDARLIFDLADDHGSHDAGGGAEVLASGPLVEDSAWAAVGLVANQATDGTLGTSGMLRVDYAKSFEHQLTIEGLAQAPDATTRAGWSQARWTSKFDDNKLELRALANAEQVKLGSGTVVRVGDPIATPDVDTTNRIGGLLGLTWRKKGHGYHVLALSAGGGAGYRGRERHDDLSLAAGDEWQLEPNIDLHYGVRSDTRGFAGDHATVVSPRVSLSWDATKEGRSDLFIAYQRVPHLDEGLPGDWRARAGDDGKFHDELAAGASYQRGDWPVMLGIGGRARTKQDALEDTIGVEGWGRFDSRRTLIHASATTLGRVGTVMAQRKLVKAKSDTLLVGATLRRDPETTTGGAAVTWQHAGRRREQKEDLSFDLAAEGYTGEAGPALRILLGGSW